MVMGAIDSMWGNRQHWVAKAACGCVVGYRRNNNEDNFFFLGDFLPQKNNGLEQILTGQLLLEKQVCFAVFDGMGGEAYGEEAAWIAAKTLKSSVDQMNGQRVDLEVVCQEANREICMRAKERRVSLEGTTAVMLTLCGREAHVVNIGDSRAFLLRNDKLRQLSVDHTDQKLLLSQGITDRRPRLTQHLGIEPEDMMLQPATTRIMIRPDDRFLLCSDGLTDMVGPEEIRSTLKLQGPVETAVERLIGRALENGGQDNITVICCQICC